MSIFVKQPELLTEPMGFDDKEYPSPTTPTPPRSNLIPDDDDSDIEAERMDTSGEDTSVTEPMATNQQRERDNLNESRKAAVQKATTKQLQINHALKNWIPLSTRQGWRGNSSWIQMRMERK